MRFVTLSLLVGLLVLIPYTGVRADYLEVRRSATIKDRPIRDAIVIERPDVGGALQLLDNGDQQNGYYRIMAPVAQNPGWIYRTLVRRHPGNPPGVTTGPTTGPQADSPDLAGDIMRVHFIDMDQGDAALLEFSCGAVLIDAGGQNDASTERLVRYLDDFFERRDDLQNTIDTVFVTHTHIDHNRALRRVVETFGVRNYVHNGILRGSGRHGANWMADHANDNGRQVNLRAVSQSEILPLPRGDGLSDAAIDPVACQSTDPDIRLLAGPYEDNPGWPSGQFDNGNNKGLVVRIDFGESSFLFTGDLEEHAIDTLVEYYDGTDMLDVDVYQVGHHGSHNGTTDSLMTSMTPEIAMISMGKSTDQQSWTAWQYGHPRRTLVELLDRWIDRPRANAQWVAAANGMRDFFQYRMRDAVYATGWDGTVVITADRSGGYSVRTSGIGGPS